MSCYFRHLDPIFKKARITVTHDNKKAIDRIFHQLVKIEYKDCPKTWKHLKEDILAKPAKIEEFAKKLKKELNKLK